jgi:hypothetical protein
MESAYMSERPNLAWRKKFLNEPEDEKESNQ